MLVESNSGASIKDVGLALAFIAFLSTLGFVDSPPSSTADGVRLQKTVDEIQRLIERQEFPDYLWRDSLPVKQPGLFDINDYFRILTHLSLDSDLALDWVYTGGGMGGRPLLFVRKLTDSTITTSDQYHDRFGGVDPKTLTWKYHFWEEIRLDGTSESFLQLTILIVQCPKFYLFWHSNYMDDRIAGTREEIDKVCTESFFGRHLPYDVVRSARQIDPATWVTSATDTTYVSFVMFSKWGGFSRYVFKYSSNFPHRLLDTDRTQLVPYDCGIDF